MDKGKGGGKGMKGGGFKGGFDKVGGNGFMFFSLWTSLFTVTFITKRLKRTQMSSCRSSSSSPPIMVPPIINRRNQHRGMKTT